MTRAQLAAFGSAELENIIENSKFTDFDFYDRDGKRILYSKDIDSKRRKGDIKSGLDVVSTLEEITWIKQRAYSSENTTSLDLAIAATNDLFETSPYGPKDVKWLITTENFPGTSEKGTGIDVVPNIAARLKNMLKIRNYKTLSYDLVGSKSTIDEVVNTVAKGENNLIISGVDTLNPTAVYEAAKKNFGSKIYDQDYLESLDNIVVVHEPSRVPNLAEKIRDHFGMDAKAYNIISGCSGYVKALIHASKLIEAGAKGVLVYGVETLKNISDIHEIEKIMDQDCLIYSCGGEVTYVTKSNSSDGIIADASASLTHGKDAYYLWMGPSINPNFDQNKLFLKMQGDRLYNRAVDNFYKVILDCLSKTDYSFEDVKKFCIHQANGKMDFGMIAKKFNRGNIKEMSAKVILDENLACLHALYGEKDNYSVNEVISVIMPMSIYEYANNSVATVPRLLRKLFNKELECLRMNLKWSELPQHLKQKYQQSFVGTPEGLSLYAPDLGIEDTQKLIELNDSKRIFPIREPIYHIVRKGDLYIIGGIGAGINIDVVLVRVP